MKKLLILFSLLPWFNSWSQNTAFITISGHVYNIQTGIGVPNHRVMILVPGPAPIFHQNVYTNANGYFEDTLTFSQITGTVMIYTQECNKQVKNQVFSFYGNANFSIDFQICVSPPTVCQANFTAIPDSNVQNLIHFTNLSTTNSVFNYVFWDFGDGQSSNVYHPIHLYNQPGTYYPKLFMKTIDSCTSLYIDTIVTMYQPQISCHANFIIQKDTNAPVPNLYHFFDNSTSTGNIIKWTWDFGDGTTDTLSQTTHQYVNLSVQPVTYTVTLTIQTNQGCLSNKSKQIVVQPAAGCYANFTFAPGSGPNAIAFTNTSLSSTPIIKQIWDFGDGTSVVQNNPVHIFPYTGIYNVKLIIKTADSCTSSIKKTVTVGNPQYFSLVGQVFYQIYPPIDTGIAYLYRDYNNYLYPIDTLYFGKYGCYYFFNVLQGNYKVKIAIPSGTTKFGKYAPTYLSDNLFWNTSQSVQLQQNIFDADIHLIPTSFSSGIGQISGVVHKSLKTSISNQKSPASDVAILLLDPNKNPVRVAYSDQNGNFVLPNLPFGTYQVYAEETGKYTVPVSLSLTNSQHNINNVYLIINDSLIHGVVLPGKTLNTLSSLVYPNPSNGKIAILFDLKEAEIMTISVLNSNGMLLEKRKAQLFSGKQEMSLDLGLYNQGLYFLSITSENGEWTKVHKIQIVK